MRKQDENEKDEDFLDLEAVEKINAANALRLAKEREAHNRRVTKEYKLKSKK